MANARRVFGKAQEKFVILDTVECGIEATDCAGDASSHAKHMSGVHHTAEKFRREGNLRPVAMTEGLIRKEEEQLRTKLERIANRQQVDPTMIPLATGVIRVEAGSHELAR